MTGLVSLGLTATGVGFGVAIKYKYMAKSSYMNIRLAMDTAGKGLDTNSLRGFASSYYETGKGEGRDLVYSDAPPLPPGYNPQTLLDKLNETHKGNNSVMENKCERLAFPAGIDAAPNSLDMKIAYATGGFYFHLLMMIWSKKKWRVHQS